jgi:hypothetical protein
MAIPDGRAAVPDERALLAVNDLELCCGSRSMSADIAYSISNEM